MLSSLKGFNSILVRLKVNKRVRQELCFGGFNSILVRLKEHPPIPEFVFESQFQFHTGSIKSWGIDV